METDSCQVYIPTSRGDKTDNCYLSAELGNSGQQDARTEVIET